MGDPHNWDASGTHRARQLTDDQGAAA